jgi:hypothetical protein
VRSLAVVVALGALGTPAAAQREPGWEVRVPERLEVAVGEGGAIAIAIAVDRGLAISKDAPVIVDLVGPPGVAIKKARLGRADAVDPGADAPRFSVVVKPSEAGEHVVKIRLRAWLCGGKVCRPLDVARQAVVAAAPKP